MGTRSLLRIASVTLSAVVFFPSSAGASEVILAQCMPLDGGDTGSSDFLDRAFYIRAFPGSNLGRVTLRFFPGTAGAEYVFTVVAHDQTFDGPVIGTVQVDIPNFTGSPYAAFDFKGAPVIPGHTIAFVVTSTQDGGAPLMANGPVGPCSIEETNGTSPPLDTDRFGKMGAVITTYGPELTAVSPNMGPPSGGTTVNLTASFVGPEASLRFGGTAASSLTIPDGGVGEAGTFAAVTPAHADGQVDVDITATWINDGGIDASATASLHNGYFYGSDVVDSGGGGDGGTTDSGATTSRADAGDNAASGGGDDSGCGCDLPGVASAPGSVGVAFVALGALFGARRRRRR